MDPQCVDVISCGRQHARMESLFKVLRFLSIAAAVIAGAGRYPDHRKTPAAVVVDCSMHQAPRSHLFPYAVKM